MARFALIGFLLSFLFVPTAQAVEPYLFTESSHPWEVRTRQARLLRSRVNRLSIEYYYQHPDRSATHALHPFHRQHYNDPPVDPYYARFARGTTGYAPYRLWNAYQPGQVETCDNYSFIKPQGIPPYGQECQ